MSSSTYLLWHIYNTAKQSDDTNVLDDDSPLGTKQKPCDSLSVQMKLKPTLKGIGDREHNLN